MPLHSQRFATETLIQLSNKIPSVDIIMEYSVKPYRIDAYIPQYNIAIEIDENDHAFYDKEKEIERSRYITQQLRCSWIRVDDQHSQQETVTYLLKQLSYYGIIEETKVEQKALPLNTELPQKTFRQQLKELKEQEAEEKARQELEAIKERQEQQQNRICRLVAQQDEVEEYIKTNNLYIIKNTAVIFKNMYNREVIDLKKTQLQDMAKILSVLGFVKKKRKIKAEDVSAINGITFDMNGQLKDVYINEKMYSELPSNSNSDFDSEYKDFSDREDIPF